MPGTDTIAAIATAAGEAGIAVVRISGPEALSVADRVIAGKRRPSEAKGQTFMVGRVVGPAGASIDEAVILVFRAPQSYTREDVVEIQVHGGRLAVRRVLAAVLAAGARAAEPGEFTRRAFLNGRIDLLQAEAVADLIRAQSDRAAAAASEQLNGAISDSIEDIYNYSVDLSANLEATMDFAEDELPVSTTATLRASLDRIRERVRVLIAGWREGHLLRDGARVVIAGEPNVGKSTLMNRLLERDRSIVTDIPGTTRDTIEELVIIDGVPVRLTDTAGLREADCVVEREGIRRAQRAIEAADLTIYMVDGSRPLSENDRQQIGQAGPGGFLVVINKADIAQVVHDEEFPDYVTRLRVSLIGRDDVPRLRCAISECLQARAASPLPHAVISERHRAVLADVLRELDDAAQVMETPGLDGALLAAEHLRESLEALGTLTGRVYSEALLDAIFGKFCIGK